MPRRSREVGQAPTPHFILFFFQQNQQLLCFPASQCRTCHLTLSDMRSASGLAAGTRGSGCVRGTRRAAGGGQSLLPASSPRGGPWCPRPGGQFPSCPCWCPAGFRKVGGASLPRPGRCSDMHTAHMRLCHPRPFRSETVGPAQLHLVKLRCETGTEEARPPAWPTGLPEPPPPRPRGLHVPLHWKSPSVPVRKT